MPRKYLKIEFFVIRPQTLTVLLSGIAICALEAQEIMKDEDKICGLYLTELGFVFVFMIPYIGLLFGPDRQFIISVWNYSREKTSLGHPWLPEDPNRSKRFAAEDKNRFKVVRLYLSLNASCVNYSGLPQSRYNEKKNSKVQNIIFQIGNRMTV